MINPYDLGDFQVAENSFKVNVDELLKKARKELKLRLLQSQIDTLGVHIGLTTSKTRFNGERIWFVCPNCGRRVGTVYKHPVKYMMGCRVCLDLKYAKQYYKGMVETKVRNI
jgi:hypothetical protein